MKFLKKIVILMLFLLPGLDGCKRTEVSGTVDATSVPPLRFKFNCTIESVIGNISEVNVAKIDNHTDVVCKVSVDVSDLKYNASLSKEYFTDLKYNASLSKEKEIYLCNYIGENICRMCINDTSYDVYKSNVTVSCVDEEKMMTTKVLPTIIETTEADTIENTSKTSTKESIKRILVPVGVGVVLILLIILIACLVRRSRNKKILANADQHDQSEFVVRMEADATGELYTVINKNLNGGDMIDNVLYDSNNESQINESGEVYSSVTKKETQNDVTGDLYTVVNKSR